MASDKTEYSERVQQLLKTVYSDCMQEDVAVRERQIRQWRRLKLLWEGFQRVWFSEVAHDWRIWDETADQDSDQSYYDKPVNVFKAYLESIIAALSVTVPPIKCYPDDADNTLDLETARAGDKIAQLVYRHNDVPILWLHALFIFVTEGMVACYNYPKEDESLGHYETKEYEDQPEGHEITTCPMCSNELEDKVIEAQEDEFMPEYEGEEQLCPHCMQMMNPTVKQQNFYVTRLVGVTKDPKSRMCLEAYGGLYVKVANYAKKQKDTPYLILSYEKDWSLVVEEYEHLWSKKNSILNTVVPGENAGSYNQYAQWGRLSPQYQGEYPLNVVTVNQAWIRPAKFNILTEKDDVDLLKKLFPKGVKVTFVNEEYACAEPEVLDDCWTILENPLSEYLHFDPMGQGLVSIQEITNDLISLVLQTIEHGIGQTFADPAVLNFNKYQQTEVTPGSIFPAKSKTGKGLGEGFYELKTATLSSEVLPFSNQIQTYAQLTSGALPSLFGGQLEGSETASQYSMSRAQALQRLQNTWKMFTVWWKTIFGKVIPMYMQEIKEDERDVQQDSNGNFINVFIRKASLEGKIGKVELEANENLPMTWAQQRDMVEKLLLNPNEKIMEILAAPENLSIIHDALGLDGFYVPGEDDVIKQNDEIKILLNTAPIPTGSPEMPEVPSVDIDPIYDNHVVQFDVVRKWAISEVGRQAKIDNEAGYTNVLLHGKLHFMQIQMQYQQPQVSGQESGAVPNKKPNPKLDEAPITGEHNVPSVH